MNSTSKVHDVLVHICRNYPHPEALSNARATKTVFLADWEMARRFGRTITNIVWEFNQYGPFVHDVAHAAATSPDLELKRTVNAFGAEKTIFRVKSHATAPSLTPDELAVIDHVISRTGRMTFAAFIDYVYDSYPVRATERYTVMDLTSLAGQSV